MNWEAWSATQAEQILELRRRVKILRHKVWITEKRARLWRERALRKAKR